MKTDRRRTWTGLTAGVVILLGLLVVATPAAAQSGWTLIGWNDLGMHCMDADFGVFSILPPYNTIHAQLVGPDGELVTAAAGITVTYEGITDPDGSINTTSAGKTNFWDHVLALFGVDLATNEGLAGFNMPGATNQPQEMHFEPELSWFTAEGIPLTPYDDSHNKNYYPVMHLVARDASGDVLATTDIVLPVSDEMTCIACHGSGTGSAARPDGGWVSDPDPERDFRLNILLLHDDRQAGNPAFTAALNGAGYNSSGLYATATGDGTAVLCAACHGSNALPGTGQTGVKPLTEALHASHAGVVNPANGMVLNASDNRTACYTCHPGSETRCLRGAMGNAVASDGSLAMQCQSCHGVMSDVGATGRAGWFDEPTCQQCHTGTATNNNGQIRYTSTFDTNGQHRQAVDSTFATNPNTPMDGYSLFRFSTGHGGLQCEACHGSTHAIFPTSHLNDNLQSLQLQGHVGTLVDCTTCHQSTPQTTSGGPHGMHPVGQEWVSRHDSAAENNRQQCRACHGTDYRGTVLSRAQGDRAVRTEFGDKNFWRGFQIGCYTCHNGPDSESRTRNQPAVVSDLAATTAQGQSVGIALEASDPDGDTLQLRIVSQPHNGTVGLMGRQATYFPAAGFSGTETFTYAAWDGSTDSNLATVTVTVGGGAGCTVECGATVPGTGTAGEAVTFSATGSSSCGGQVSYAWNFGDGSPTGSSQNPGHTYAAAGSYTWTLTVTADGDTCTRSGVIEIQAAPTCTVQCGATVPGAGTAGEAVTFSATGSSSCGGQASYAWNFGDGSPAASSQNPGHTYAAAGSYTWTLTVTADGDTCTRSGVIEIQAAPTCTLTCTAEVPRWGRLGQAVTFHGEAQGEGCPTPVLSWNFGDGSGAVQGNEVSHSYSDRGIFDWKMRATAAGAQCESSGVIRIGSEDEGHSYRRPGGRRRY